MISCKRKAIKHLKWSLVFLVGSFVFLYIGFVIQPYYYAWKYDAELVSETFIPTPISRAPCLNGRALVYMQDAGDEGFYLRVIDGESQIDVEGMNHKWLAENYYNVGGFNWCPTNIMKEENPYMVSWEEGPKDKAEYAFLVKRFLKGSDVWTYINVENEIEYISDFTTVYAVGKVSLQDKMSTNAQLFVLGNKLEKITYGSLVISDHDVEVLFFANGWIVFLESGALLAKSLVDEKVIRIGTISAPAIRGKNFFVSQNKLLWKEKKSDETTVISSFDFNTMMKAPLFTPYSLDGLSVDEDVLLFSGKIFENQEKGLFLLNMKSQVTKKLQNFPRGMNAPVIYNGMVYWEEKLFYPYSFIESIMAFFGVNLLWSDPDVLPSQQSYLFRKSY